MASYPCPCERLLERGDAPPPRPRRTWATFRSDTTSGSRWSWMAQRISASTSETSERCLSSLRSFTDAGRGRPVMTSRRSERTSSSRRTISRTFRVAGPRAFRDMSVMHGERYVVGGSHRSGTAEIRYAMCRRSFSRAEPSRFCSVCSSGVTVYRFRAPRQLGERFSRRDGAQRDPVGFRARAPLPAIEERPLSKRSGSSSQHRGPEPSDPL